MQLSSNQITKKSRSNLALAFICLPKEKRAAMSTFYAFCRVVDDIVDRQPLDPIRGRRELDRWREEIHKCYTSTPTEPLALELAQLIRTHALPSQFFLDIIDGMEMDLEPRRYANFKELETYCYRVASAVGLVSIQIFGCTHAQSRDYAIALGMAFQLTNILRDVRGDLRLGRVYLPQDEMAALGVTERDLAQSTCSPAVRKLLRLHYLRAVHFFEKAKRLIHPEDRRHLVAAQMMTDVYRRILERLRELDFELPDPPLRLSRFEKLRCIASGISRRFVLKRSYQDPDKKPQHIAVWGGGFAGMSAAVHATLSGHTVDLYEAKAYWGGRAHSFREVKSGEIIDNGQHIFLGCYSACMELFELLGVTDKLVRQPSLSLAFCSAKRGMSHLRASNLRAPWHLASALLGFKELNWNDKLAILTLGWKIRRRRRSYEAAVPERTETVASWLKRLRQTDGAIRALWEPLCLAALNEPIQTACAGLFYNVILQSIFGGKADSAIYLSRVGLSELLMPEVELLLKMTGGSANLSCGVRSVQFEDDRIQSFQTTDGRSLTYDAYVSALSWQALAALLPEKHVMRRAIERIESSPIINLHLWTRTQLTQEPIVGLLDSPIHWLFDRTAPEHRQKGEYLYALVISGAYSLVTMPSQELVELAKRELERLLPRVGPIRPLAELEDGEAISRQERTQALSVLTYVMGARASSNNESARQMRLCMRSEITHSFVYKSKDATFAAHPGTEALRQDEITPWKNFYLAGDWTRTDLPATLEGAVQSGRDVVQHF